MLHLRKESPPVVSRSPTLSNHLVRNIVKPGGQVEVARPEASRRQLLALTAILAVSVAFRVGSALYLGDHVTILPGIYDQVSYHTLAVRVITGHGFTFGTDWWPATGAGQPTAHWSFLYTLYVAVVYRIFGIHPLAARLIQAVVAGTLQPLLTWKIGRRIFGQGIGLVAAALSSVYVYFFYYGGALMTETFYILAILWALDLLLLLAQSEKMPSLRQPATWVPWLGLGLALGIAALLRQVILLVLPFTIAWLFIVRSKRASNEASSAQPQSFRSMVIGVALSVSVIVTFIAPFTIRNYLAFHEFVLLNTNDGYAFFWGNNPIYGTNFVPILPSAEYQQLIPANLKGLNEAALNDALLRQGVGFVIVDPRRYVLLSISRIKSYFDFWPSADSGIASNVGRTLSFGVLLPFMIIGLYLTVRDSRAVTQDLWHGLLLLILFISIYTAIHLLTWALIRYRLPVDAILILFAARSIEPVLARICPTRFEAVFGLRDESERVASMSFGAKIDFPSTLHREHASREK